MSEEHIIATHLTVVKTCHSKPLVGSISAASLSQSLGGRIV